MIENIFKYLSWNDQKVAALTCKRWHQITNLSSIVNNLKLNIDTNEIFYSLINSTRNYNQITFQSLNFNHISVEVQQNFWLRVGPFVRTLTFKDCKITITQLLQIIREMPKLEELALSIIVIFEKLHKPVFQSELEQLEGVFSNIKVFKITYNSKLSDVVFNKLMAMMPNLEYLKIYRTMDTLQRQYDITWPNLRQYLTKKANKIRTLKVCGWIMDDNAFNDLATIQNLNLHCLAITVFHYSHNSNRNAIAIFLRTQKDLKELKICCQYLSGDDILEIAKHLTNLKVLKLECMSLDRNMIMNLRNLKNLEVLSYDLEITDSSPEAATFLGDTKENTTLKKLQLTVYTGNVNIHPSKIDTVNLLYIQNYVTSFKNLTKLNLRNGCNDKVLQAINEQLIKLTKLEIQNENITDFGITGSDISGYSISRLTHLKTLRICSDGAITELSFREIGKCQELVALDIDTTMECQPKLLNEILKKYGSLEALFLRHEKNIPLSYIPMIVKDVPRLKHYSII